MLNCGHFSRDESRSPMSGNSFGTLFCVTSFGESHGPAIGCVVDGCPPGLVLSEADIQAATGKSLAELDPTLTRYTGKTYEGAQLYNLAKQLAAATSSGALQGGAYGVVGGNIGFATEEAKKLLGDNTSAVGQVFLDAASNLLDKGITDLNQLKIGDIMGQATVQPQYDGEGRPTGKLLAVWGGDDYTPSSRVLTDQEAANLKQKPVQGEGGSDTTYEPINIAIGKVKNSDLQSWVSENLAHLIVRIGLGPNVIIGPLVIPGKTPCFNCVLLSEEESSLVWQGLHYADQVEMTHSLTSSALNLIGGMLALSIAQFADT